MNYYSVFVFILCQYLRTSQAISGKATYYGGNNGGGACGYKQPDSFLNGFYAAAGGSTFNNGLGCGACYQVTCVGPYDSSNTGCKCSSSKSVVVQVFDQCPECGKTHFDLNANAMKRITNNAGLCGVIKMNYKRVSCNARGNIKIRNKSGVSKYWYGLHVDNVKGNGALKKVEVLAKGSTSKVVGTCNKNNPSFWLCSGSPFPTPKFGIRLTDSGNRKLALKDVIVSGNDGFGFSSGSIDTKKQFGGISAFESAPTTEAESASSMNPAALAAVIIICALAVCCIGGGVAFFCVRRKKSKYAENTKQMEQVADTPIAEEDQPVVTGQTDRGQPDDEQELEIEVEVELNQVTETAD